MELCAGWKIQLEDWRTRPAELREAVRVCGANPSRCFGCAYGFRVRRWPAPKLLQKTFVVASSLDRRAPGNLAGQVVLGDFEYLNPDARDKPEFLAPSQQ